MTAAWPAVVDRLVGLLPTLPDWSGVTVYDGPPVTADAPPEYVTVGFVDGVDFGGTYEQARGPGDCPEELGTVRSEVVAWTGDTDLPGLRARGFELVNAWERALHNDPTLGVLPQGSTASLAVDVAPAQTTAGAVQRLTVTLTYTARCY